MVAPATMAEISLYGKAHIALEYADVKDSSEKSEADVVSNASRLGVKGDVEISKDLYGIFQYEFGIDIDGSSGNKAGDFISQRNQFVGLKGNFGKILVGRHDTPLKKLEGKIEMFGDTYADFGKVFDYYVDSQERENRFIGYYSPKFSGLQFNIATMPGKEDDASVGDAISSAIVYGDKKLKKSDFYAGLGYDSAVDGEDTSVIRLVAKTKFGGLSLGTILEQADDGQEDQFRYMVSAAYKMGKFTLKAQYAGAEEVENNKDASDQVSLGLDYKLGKNTNMYVLGSRQDLGGKYSSSTNTFADSTKTNFFSVGVIHKF